MKGGKISCVPLASECLHYDAISPGVQFLKTPSGLKVTGTPPFLIRSTAELKKAFCFEIK